MRRPLPLLCLLGLLLPSGAAAQAPPTTPERLKSQLAASMRQAGRASGVYVVDATSGDALYGLRSGTARVLASNTKLFTTAAALGRHRAGGTFETRVLGDGSLLLDGTWQGDVYLRGGGDPTFGTAAFNRRNYGEGANMEVLVEELQAAGVRRVTGRVIGDEGVFDHLRGGPYSGFGLSHWVGPLSGLAFNRGFADERGRSFQVNPPGFAATRLTQALERAGIDVRGQPGIADAPGDADELAEVQSPPMSRIVQITNTRSDNFFAEMLLKGLSAPGPDPGGSLGTTAGGARAARSFARSLGTNVRLADGSGLSRGNRASPKQVVRLLTEMRERGEDATAFDRSLAVAGRTGTLATRMRGTAARNRCRAKTGTISGVSTLSGYCDTRGGSPVAFSILMNGVSAAPARRLQDRMLDAMVRYAPAPEAEPAG